MARDKTKRPTAFVEAHSPGIVVEKNTGEIIIEPGRTRLVRAYTPSVEQVVALGAHQTKFRLVANKYGRIVSAMGPILVNAVDMSFPGCASVEEIDEADEALNRAGATRGASPAGRALDWALRQNDELAQWRVKRETMEVFASALYGGIQFGGERKPKPKPGRIAIDIISSYPFVASRALPRVRDVAIERGLRRGAVLVKIAGTQSAPALFSRNADGGTQYDEDVFGWYVKEEVDYHASMGRVDVQTVLASATFSHYNEYLAPTVEHFFAHREKFGRGTPGRTVLKSAVNGLLGKFASPISTWRTPKPMEIEYAKKKRHAEWKELGSSFLINDLSLSGIYPRHCNIIWTALTYARARVRLWEKIDEIALYGGRVLWCHTDSIIADVPPEYRFVSGSALGDWREVE